MTRPPRGRVERREGECAYYARWVAALGPDGDARDSQQVKDAECVEEGQRTARGGDYGCEEQRETRHAERGFNCAGELRRPKGAGKDGPGE